MSSVFSCIDFHDDLLYDLGLMDHVELFGVEKTKFKKATAITEKKNKIHMGTMINV
jgi:hypothetical protein